MQKFFDDTKLEIRLEPSFNTLIYLKGNYVGGHMMEIFHLLLPSPNICNGPAGPY